MQGIPKYNYERFKSQHGKKPYEMALDIALRNIPRANLQSEWYFRAIKDHPSGSQIYKTLDNAGIPRFSGPDRIESENEKDQSPFFESF